MKILVICQHYYPEPIRIADFCETLVERGHEVDVVCGVPNYPMGVIYEEYRQFLSLKMCEYIVFLEPLMHLLHLRLFRL